MLCKKKAVEAYSTFVKEVRDLKYPSLEHDIKIEEKELQSFLDFIKNKK